MKKLSNLIYFGLIVTTSTIFVGIVIGFYCDVFNQLDLIAKSRLISHPSLYLITTPVLFWVAAYLVRKFSPNSSGSVLEYIKASLEETVHNKNPQKIKGFLSFKIAFFTFVSSLVCSFGGGALGREGPSVHMAAGLFADIANKFKNKIPQINVQNWIFSGAALGLAVAFNAPLAGLIYVLEKLLKNRCYDFKTNSLFIVCVMILFVLFLQRVDPIFFVSNLGFEFSDQQLTLIIIVAAVCGLLAFIFKQINVYLRDKLIVIKSKYWHLIPITIGFVVALISLYCGVYSFSGGIATANQALAHHEILLSYKEVIGRILNTILTFASGAAGGLIAPSVTIGAGVASIIASFAGMVDFKILILVGMASFLAVILGEPVASAVLIYEAANQSASSLPFLVFASFIAISMARLFKFTSKTPLHRN